MIDIENLRSGIVTYKLMQEVSSRTAMVYVQLTATMNEDGIVTSSKREIGEPIGMNHTTVGRHLKKLEDLDYIATKTVEEVDIVSLMKKKNLKGLGKGRHVCEWCEIKTNVLDGHHYPIPKSKGGEDIVSICPNCHAEYHRFESGYKINESAEVIKEWYEQSIEGAKEMLYLIES